MSYIHLHQNQRLALLAFLDPKNSGTGLEIINLVAAEVGVQKETIIRYMADPIFMEVMNSISTGLENLDLRARAQQKPNEETD